MNSKNIIIISDEVVEQTLIESIRKHWCKLSLQNPLRTADIHHKKKKKPRNNNPNNPLHPKRATKHKNLHPHPKHRATIPEIQRIHQHEPQTR